MKKKGKNKAGATRDTKDGSKNSKKKRVKRGAPGKNLDPAKVRQEIAGIVKAGAKGITKAVMVQANQGQLAPAKYLLEMAGVYPLATDELPTNDREHCLAETLMDRMNIPKTPVVHDELQKEEDEDVLVIQPKKETEDSEKGEAGEEKEEAVRAQ